LGEIVNTAALILGIFFLTAVGVDTFQTIILPRRPSGQLRITRLFFIVTWGPWSAFAKRVKDKNFREEVYGFYGPLFRTDLYVSGTTLFTLGLGDVVPHSVVARALIIFESGTGLGFVALVIGYLPVLYQAFSRAKSRRPARCPRRLAAHCRRTPPPPRLLRRQEALTALLAEWERWSAEILESHISYPILCYYRSQHDNQSWLSALTAILDTCSLLITTVEGPSSPGPAHLRHRPPRPRRPRPRLPAAGILRP
jgi:hypothetical protein